MGIDFDFCQDLSGWLEVRRIMEDLIYKECYSLFIVFFYMDIRDVVVGKEFLSVIFR